MEHIWSVNRKTRIYCASISIFLIILVPSIHNVCKDQMYYYNWSISGDMFRPLTGHPQANME